MKKQAPSTHKMEMRQSKASKASEKPKKSVSIRPIVSVMNDTTIILPKPILKRNKKPEDRLDANSKKKREQKVTTKKVVVDSNPEEMKPLIVAKKAKPAKVPVKRARKPQGKFTDLPADVVMAAKGARGFVDFVHLYNRPAAPPMFKEGEEGNDEEKMGVHDGMIPLMKKLLDSCQPTGQSTILLPTLLQHW